MLLPFENRPIEGQIFHLFYSPPPVKIREEMCEVSQSVIRRIIYNLMYVLDFRYVAPFLNQSTSKATGV